MSLEMTFLTAEISKGGRYASSGAIAGPIVSLDMRDIEGYHLNWHNRMGSSCLPDIISYIEAGTIRPLLAKTYALKDIARRKKNFLKRVYR